MAEPSRQQAPRPSLLYQFMHYIGVPFMLAIWTDLRVEGLENLPTGGGYILAANHPDNLDTYCIGLRIRQTVHFLARPDGMRSRWLGTFWRLMAAIPADRDGLTEAVALVRAGDVVGVYPDGVITPRLLRARAGVGALAARTGAPVIPVAIWGTERVRLWPLRGGKRQRVVVRYGRPLRFTRADVRTLGLQGIADAVMRAVAEMLPPAYRGAYATPAIQTRAPDADPDKGTPSAPASKTAEDRV